MRPYRLSNRQRKDLAVRAAQLQIAIPLPIDSVESMTIGQMTQFVIENLRSETIKPTDIRNVREDVLCMAPAVHSGDHPLGTILSESQAIRNFHIVVEVVIATISLTDNPRHFSTRLEWPGDLSLILPRPAGQMPPKE